MSSNPSDRSRKLRDLCVCKPESNQGLVKCMELVERHLSSVRQPGELGPGDELVLRFEKIIQATVNKRIHRDRKQDAEDCAQDFWAKMFGHTEDGRWRLREWRDRDDRSPFCFFLLASVANHVIDWNLKKITKLIRIDIEGIVAGRHEHDESEPGALAAVYECLSQVSPESQKLFRLRIEEQLEWANIARELGVCEKTAFNRWNNLLGLLQKYLKLKGFDL